MGILLKEWFLSFSMMLLQRMLKIFVHCVPEKEESVLILENPGTTKGSFFHQIIKGSIVKGGDFINRNGTGGENIYPKFPDESPKLKHDSLGILSMEIADRDTTGSHFIITLKADHHLDRKHVAFGKLVLGYDVLKKIEDVGDEGLPSVTVKIINSGEHNEDGKKTHKSKIGRNGSSEAISHEARRKGKHKKSSVDRRKKRKHYSSESDSSSDSDTESSESDSDSDLDLSSSSYTSSSSDDRWKKRKRYRKDKHRHGKRRDKRREKKRRKLDKRSKHKSKRESDSQTDADSASKRNDSSNGQGLDTQRNAEVQSSSILEKESSPMNLKKREGLSNVEDGEFPKENGAQRSNGTRANHRSDRYEERLPDVMDDNPGKSRSRSMSLKQTVSKSMSISPKRRRPQFKDFIKVIQQEQNSYKDPITEFLACVYINYDFDCAQKKMRECEEVILNDPFLGKRVEEVFIKI
ncbi:hypothetical protein RYX36_026097 [Vicia faba]